MPTWLAQLRLRLVVGAAVALALAGCGDGAGDTAATGGATGTPAPTGTVTVTPTPTAPESPTPGGSADVAAFVAAVRASAADVAAGRTDEEIGQLGVQACAGLTADQPADELVAAMQSLGTLDAEATDQATARELVKLAIDTVCLDQAGRVDEF